MSEGKEDFGVVKYGNFVWTFAGWRKRQELTTCEKFDIHSREWVPVACTTYAYHTFSPCVYQDEIYLPATVFVPQELEIFTPARNCFRLTQWTWTHISYHALEFIRDNTLFISYMPKSVRKIDLDTGKDQAECEDLDVWNFQVDTAPVWVGSRILWGSGGHALQFSYDTGVQEEVTRTIFEEYEIYTGSKPRCDQLWISDSSIAWLSTKSL